MAPKSPIGLILKSYPGDNGKTVRTTACLESYFNFGQNLPIIILKRKTSDNDKKINLIINILRIQAFPIIQYRQFFVKQKRLHGEESFIVKSKTGKSGRIFSKTMFIYLFFMRESSMMPSN